MSCQSLIFQDQKELCEFSFYCFPLLFSTFWLSSSKINTALSGLLTPMMPPLLPVPSPLQAVWHSTGVAHWSGVPITAQLARCFRRYIVIILSSVFWTRVCSLGRAHSTVLMKDVWVQPGHKPEQGSLTPEMCWSASIDRIPLITSFPFSTISNVFFSIMKDWTCCAGEN